MKILVLNCGSSSVKYMLFNMEEEKVLVKGIIEKIGLKGSYMEYEKEAAPELILECILSRFDDREYHLLK